MKTIYFLNVSLSSAIIIKNIYISIICRHFLKEMSANLLLGLQQLQITIENTAQNTAQQSTTSVQQPYSPELTTRDNMLAIVKPIKKIINIIKARNPQHPPSESDCTFQHPAYKRQTFTRMLTSKEAN